MNHGPVLWPMISSSVVLDILQVPDDSSRPSPIPGMVWRDAWDNVVVASEQCAFLQLWGWGEHAARHGARVERWALLSGGVPVGVAQVLIESARAGVMASVPHGPVCPPGSDAWATMMTGLINSYRRRTIALRTEPPLLDSPVHRKSLESAGFRPVAPVQPRSTLVLDLMPEDPAGAEHLLSNMHQKCRYNVRLSAKRDVSVSLCGEESLDEFEAMLTRTAERHGLTVRAPGYHRSAFEALTPSGARLYAARHAGETLAMIMVTYCGGRATYLYGASTERERGRMPNHALQWRAIVDARESGCSTYDFWGVPDEIGVAAIEERDRSSVPEGDGGLWGVWRFKRGFGGRIERRVGRWDHVLSPLRYAVGVSLPAAIRHQRTVRDGAR